MTKEELKLRWEALERQLEQRFGKIPSMESILFLIGANEYRGRMPKYRFSKEEKQDLMHVGTCTLLGRYGYYGLDYYDQEGWPHFNKLKDLNHLSLAEQEDLLKESIIGYFDELGKGMEMEED